MKTYEQAVHAAQGNVLATAIADALALRGLSDAHPEQLAVVFTANAPGQELIGVWSFDEGLESMADLTTIGLLHQGVDLLLHPPAGPAADDDIENDEEEE